MVVLETVLLRVTVSEGSSVVLTVAHFVVVERSRVDVEVALTVLTVVFVTVTGAKTVVAVLYAVLVSAGRVEVPLTVTTDVPPTVTVVVSGLSVVVLPVVRVDVNVVVEVVPASVIVLYFVAKDTVVSRTVVGLSVVVFPVTLVVMLSTVVVLPGRVTVDVLTFFTNVEVTVTLTVESAAARASSRS